MKKILSILLTLTMVFTLVPNMSVSVRAEDALNEQQVIEKVDAAADSLFGEVEGGIYSLSEMFTLMEMSSISDFIAYFESMVGAVEFNSSEAPKYKWTLYTGDFLIVELNENGDVIYAYSGDLGEFTLPFQLSEKELQVCADVDSISNQLLYEGSMSLYNLITDFGDNDKAFPDFILVQYEVCEDFTFDAESNTWTGTNGEAGSVTITVTYQGAIVKSVNISFGNTMTMLFEAPPLIEPQNFTLTKTADGYKVTAMPCSLPEKITEEAKSSYWLVWWGISDDDAAIIDEDYAGQTVWNLFSNSMSGMIGQVEMGDPSAGSEDGELMHFNRDWSESLNISYSGTEELKWLIVFKVVDYEVDEGYEDLDNICTMGGTNSIPTVINQSTGNMLGGGDGLPEVSVIYKNSNDFDVTSDTPSKTFTQGETSLSTIHIDGLTPEKVGSADNGFIGILVKNGNYTLQYGEDKDYTITNGSLQVNLTKKYLDNLLAGTHDVKVYVKLDGEAKTDDNDYVFDVNVIINAKSAPAPTPTPEPSNPGSLPRPGYRAPNTGVSGATTMILNNGFIELGTIAVGLTIGFILNKKKQLIKL